jgi:broad specificity phosphatase PhoE
MNTLSSLSLVRHAESQYGELSRKKKEIPGFTELAALVQGSLKDPRIAEKIEDKIWPNADIVAIAREVHQRMLDVLPLADEETPLTSRGEAQALEAGARLRTMLPVPQRIYVSPYLRTRHTLDLLSVHWTDLKNVPVTVEPDIREQQHGLSAYYKDPNILCALQPEEVLRFEKAGKYHYRHLEGENVPDLRARVAGFIEKIVTRQDADVLSVTHDRTILAFRSLLERWNESEHIRHMRTSTPKETSATQYVRGANRLVLGAIVQPERMDMAI